MKSLVSLKDVSVFFSKKCVLSNISFTLKSGSILTLLGPNGAGKSTTISILSGLIAPTSGTAFIQGKNILSDMALIRENLGICPQHDVLFPDMTVAEHLAMFARFKGVPKKNLKKVVDDMIETVGLTEKRNIYSKQLSGGMKRKLSVGIAFIGDSKVM